ncbi:hypothetical protein EXIGLDRAFT_718522 [Exidia glandulosa HHB12029]|uniref:Uncharacterized protein n=1 Tax=Exidia glandulosa HHB12029 TaxID=1314781 RepID=A0A166BIM2_EXIGL|nr:hypothetical protein EXIGLDRAFT_718522 [Exidia glandulosa HHB12029]
MDACERIISQLAAALTESCDVLELDSVTSKLAHAVHWAVKVRMPEGVLISDSASQTAESGTVAIPSS